MSLALVLCFFFAGAYGGLQSGNKTFSVYTAEKITDLVDMSSTDGILDTIHTDDEMDCMRMCGRSNECVSFFYNHGAHSCRLHWGRLCNMPSVVVTTASNIEFYRMTDRVRFPADCYEVLLDGKNSSEVYTIFVAGSFLEVYCDQDTDGGGWLVFQRRQDGSVDFYRGWTEYEKGFGNITNEFWLGNEFLAKITSPRKYTLRIDLESFENEKRFVVYDIFKVDEASTNYMLHLGDYQGTAGDALRRSSGREFSTKDADNDAFGGGSCALRYDGAWWYDDCHDANLNGLYLGGPHASYADGINWRQWKGYQYSLKTTEMKLRPKC